jgi:hypothetical protein
MEEALSYYKLNVLLMIGIGKSAVWQSEEN